MYDLFDKNDVVCCINKVNCSFGFFIGKIFKCIDIKKIKFYISFFLR